MKYAFDKSIFYREKGNSVRERQREREREKAKEIKEGIRSRRRK
jgi:hypothetical protein